MCDNTLESLAALKPDWDYDGAKAITPEALSAAYKAMAKAGYPVPRSDGGIDLIWIIDSQEFCLEIGPDGRPRE